MARQLGSVVVMAWLWAGAAAAQGVPGRISFTGNLSNAAGVLNGQHAFKFALYDSLTGTNLAWSEEYSGGAALQVANGLVFAELGSKTELTAAVFNGAQLYLEITVDGTAMSPRLAIDSVPYAIRAGVANSAETLGSMSPGDVQRRVTGTCSGNNFMQSVAADGTVTCASPATTGSITNAMLANSSLTVTAGAGLTGGGAVALGGNTTLSLGTVSTANGGTGLTTAPSASGQYLRSTTAGSWSIGPISTSDLPPLTGDVSGTQAATTVTALRGHSVATTAPTTGQFLAWSGTQWVPADLSAILAPPVYSSAPLTTSWEVVSSQWAPPSFTKDALGFVHLRGVVRQIGSGISIFVLPVGYRPAAVLQFTTRCGNSTVCFVFVDTFGSVAFASAAGDDGGTASVSLSLDGIVFDPR